MKLSDIDRHIRAFRRYNEGAAKATNPRPPRQETQEDKALRELAWVLRRKIQRRCAPFVPPPRRPAFRLVP